MKTAMPLRLILIACIAGCATPAAAQSQTPAPKSGYPDKSIRLLVGVPPGGRTPEEFAAEINRQLELLGKVIKAAGMKAQ